MKVTLTDLPGLLVIEPQVFADERGLFFESFNERRFRELTGVDAMFVQDNHSQSGKGVLRGLHYQVRQPQGKLVRVARGEIFDVAVDLRPGSAHFGQWWGDTLSASNRRQLWIPPGFAHGFVVVGEGAEVLYKTTGYYSPEDERCIVWNDPELAIKWPLCGMPVLSARDAAGEAFARP